MHNAVLVIDQGTTSTRAIVFDAAARILAMAQEEFPQIYPRPGEVEHDPDAIWRTVLATGRAALAQAGLEPGAVAGLGIANQRETVVIWDRSDGRAIHNAIVWQDRRTAAHCAALEKAGHAALVAERTGLRIDPYFSATKIAWILDAVPGARRRADQGRLAFGTIDSFLLWRLTEGKVHATDATNAARTLLFDIHRGAWDDDLLRLFGVPRSMLPEVRDNAAEFGAVAPGRFGAALAVRGLVGDQQGALIGQACFSPGMIKSTFGTGAFILLNTGDRPVASTHKLVTTIAYQWGGTRHYALEGSIFSAGATVQWLRDGLGIVGTAAETGTLAAAADPAQAVYIVPAFVGLGAPYWDSAARGAIHGLTRGAGRRELARAALESTAYQARDLIAAMRADAAAAVPAGEAAVIRVDGGMSASDWTMQFLADMLDAPVHRPHVLETTALGAGFLAGWQAGLFDGPSDFAGRWRLEKSFAPAMAAARRSALYEGWREAVRRTVS